MTNITEPLLKEKLTEWTPSTKVQETLGLTSMDESSFKKELVALETKGLIVRMGAKKGLKFKYGSSETSGVTEVQEDGQVKIITETPTNERVSKSKKQHKITIEDIACEVTCLDKNEFSAEVTNVEIPLLLSFILKNPGEHSLSLSFKRSQKGIVVKTYKDIYLLSEVFYTREAFVQLIKTSGITLE